MNRGAHVGSIDAVREFRASLCTFLFEAREALGTYDLEVRRTLDWLLETQPKYWQQSNRKADEAVVQAKIDLERCRHTRLPGGETPSCMEERKILDRARQRQRYVEQKVELVRKWGYVAQRESTEYTSRANQLGGELDGNLPRAIAMIDRALTALEAYAALNFEGRSTAGLQGAEMPSVAQPLPLQLSNDLSVEGNDAEHEDENPTARGSTP